MEHYERAEAWNEGVGKGRIGHGHRQFLLTRSGVRHPCRLDDYCVQLRLALAQLGEDVDEVATHRAADAAVIHLKDFLIRVELREKHHFLERGRMDVQQQQIGTPIFFEPHHMDLQLRSHKSQVRLRVARYQTFDGVSG